MRVRKLDTERMEEQMMFEECRQGRQRSLRGCMYYVSVQVRKCSPGAWAYRRDREIYVIASVWRSEKLTGSSFESP